LDVFLFVGALSSAQRSPQNRFRPARRKKRGEKKGRRKRKKGGIAVPRH